MEHNEESVQKLAVSELKRLTKENEELREQLDKALQLIRELMNV